MRVAIGLGLAALMALAGPACAPVPSPPATAPPPAEPAAADTSARPHAAATDTLPEPVPPEPSAPWSPPEAEPSPSARQVLESLVEPERIAIPADLERPTADLVRPPAPDAPRDGCLEVQLAATGDRARAEVLADEARRRLDVPVRVVAGGGLYRVRAGRCVAGEEAERLRERARRLGYADAFLVPVE